MPPTTLQLPNPFPRAKWTIIIHLAAESDLIFDLIGIYDRLTRSGSIIGKVNYVVLYDGLKITPPEVPGNFPGMPSLYYVRQQVPFSRELPFHVLPDTDLTLERNFVKAIQLIETRFPAEHYAFIYAGHGAAGATDIGNGSFSTRLDHRLVIDGVAETDEELEARLTEKYETEKWKFFEAVPLAPELAGSAAFNILVVLRKDKEQAELSYHQLANYLQKAMVKKLDFICLDNCWGQMTENAEAFKNCTHYLVASVDEMPVNGIGYEGFCQVVNDNPDITPSELASIISSTFFLSNYNDYMSDPSFKDMGISLSCISVGNFSRFYMTALDTLVEYMIANMERLRPVIRRARYQCIDHTYQPDNEYQVYNIDISWFLQNLIHFIKDKDPVLVSHAREVITQLKLRSLKAFIANNYKENEFGTAAMGGYGFTICFPPTIGRFNKSIYGSKYASSHPHLHTGQWKWKQFLESYLWIMAEVEHASYSALFQETGIYHPYAGYFTSNKEDDAIATEVRNVVLELTGTGLAEPETSISKWKH